MALIKTVATNLLKDETVKLIVHAVSGPATSFARIRKVKTWAILAPMILRPKVEL
jgi:hypothetical protein